MDAPAAEQLRARATVHWHAEPVCSMAFSPDDAYLLSGAQALIRTEALERLGWWLGVNTNHPRCAGGHEGVLVIWDLSNGRRTYLPRLGKLRACVAERRQRTIAWLCSVRQVTFNSCAGTCLRHISPCAADPSCVAVSLSDNLVRMVSQHTRMVRLAQRMPAWCSCFRRFFRNSYHIGDQYERVTNHNMATLLHRLTWQLCKFALQFVACAAHRQPRPQPAWQCSQPPGSWSCWVGRQVCSFLTLSGKQPAGWCTFLGQ